MNDKFFLSGLDSSRWFGKHFEDFHLFGYIGDRDKLHEVLAKRSLLRRLIEVIAPRVNIGTILNALTEFPLVRVDPEKTLAKEIINLVLEEENRRKLTDTIRRIYERGLKEGTYYHHVASRSLNKATLFETSLNAIHGTLITVEGQLVHRKTISQYSDGTATLDASTGNWILADCPPHAFVEWNKRFTGKVLLLKEDEGFSDVFANYLPFNKRIGWYPYVRVTGFFDASRVQTEVLPSLSISLVEYRRPRLPREIMTPLLDFTRWEFEGKPIYLDDWSDLVLFGYLVPILFAGANMTPKNCSDKLNQLLQKYQEKVGADLPSSLRYFYDGLPKPDAA